MFVVIKKIAGLSTSKVSFFTALIEEREKTEFESFYDKDFSSHASEMSHLTAVILEIANRGAYWRYFKHERKAQALPKPTEALLAGGNLGDYGIRLYCLRISDDTVILLNGGIKTDIDPEKCDNVRAHFRLANRISAGLDASIESGDLKISKPNSLIDFEFFI